MDRADDRLQEAEWGDMTAYYVKGHVSREEFVAILKAAGHDEWADTVGADEIHHDQWRCVPDSTGQFDIKIIDHATGRGSFPVSVIFV